MAMSRACLKSIRRHLLEECRKTEMMAREICNDPLNGCPGDFAEEFGRRLERTSRKLERLDYQILHYTEGGA